MLVHQRQLNLCCFNNDHRSVQNAPVKMGIKQIGAVIPLGTVLNQLPHINANQTIKKGRLNFLKRSQNNKWFFGSTAPYLKVRDFLNWENFQLYIIFVITGKLIGLV